MPGPRAPFHARLVTNERVTAADHIQDVRLISLSLDGSNIRSVPPGTACAHVCERFLPLCRHRAGDVLMVRPQNSPAAVDEFLRAVRLDSGQGLQLDSTDCGGSSYTGPLGLHITYLPHPAATPPPSTLPSSCTAGWLATHYLDIQSTPRRSFFELLAHFCPSEVEKEKLTEFTTAEGQVSDWRGSPPLGV